MDVEVAALGWPWEALEDLEVKELRPYALEAEVALRRERGEQAEPPVPRGVKPDGARV